VVLVLELRPLNLEEEVIELMLDVLGSSQSAFWLDGKSSVCSVGMLKNMSGWVTICCDTPAVNSLTCLRRYSKNASLFHLPTSIIVEVRTFAKYNSIAQLDLSE
jgi:hypothetical protein